jgi:alkanesulfonate monooxygenase SsuD/methylene tetrahydromethanopterin reductase-like flavin-dependent oxidoreductase (luciferase family)
LGDYLPDPHTGEYNESQPERYRMWIEEAVRAEQLGFASCWFGEHHFNDYAMSVPQIMLAAVAAQTEHIRLGTAVSLLANQDPVRLAEDFATLDLISGGRAEIGFGGGISLHTFKHFGQNSDDSNALMTENLELLQRLWNEDQVTWSGKFRAPLENVRIQPRTFSGAAIPIHLATGISEERARMAGAAGHGLMVMTILGTYPDYRDVVRVYRESYQQAGHDPAAMRVSAIAYVHLRSDGVDAVEFWNPYQINYRAFTKRMVEALGMPVGFKKLVETVGRTDPNIKRHCDLVGDENSVIDGLLAANEDLGGVDTMLCYFDCGGLAKKDTWMAMDVFGEKVIPKIAAATGSKTD